MSITIGAAIWWALVALVAVWAQGRFIGLTLFRSKLLIEINLKSGQTITQWFADFSIRTTDGAVTTVKWKTSSVPNVLTIEPGQIACVRQLDMRKSVWRYFGFEI